MSTINSRRRNFSKALGSGAILVSSGGFIRSAHAFIDPVSGGIIAAALGSAIVAISNWFSAERRSEVDRKLAAAGYQHYWLTKLVGDEVITMDVAGQMYKSSLMTLGLLDNASKDGTSMHLKDGLIYVQRGGEGDLINAKEGLMAERLAAERYGSLPIPVEKMANNNLTKLESYRIRDDMEKSGIDTSQVALMSSRRYSVSRYPNKSSPNVEMIAYLDKSLPMVNNLSQVKYAHITV